jgi:hypothetical protein
MLVAKLNLRQALPFVAQPRAGDWSMGVIHQAPNTVAHSGRDRLRTATGRPMLGVGREDGKEKGHVRNR